MDDIKELLDTKVDKEFVDQIIDRINKIEEMAASNAAKAAELAARQEQ